MGASLSGQIFRVSEKIDESGRTLLSEIGNMMTNITGSSILKSAGHTSQVKPGNCQLDSFIVTENPVVTTNQHNLKSLQTQNSLKLFQMMNLKLEFQNLKMIGSHVKVQKMRMNISMMLLAL